MLEKKLGKSVKMLKYWLGIAGHYSHLNKRHVLNVKKYKDRLAGQLKKYSIISSKIAKILGKKHNLSKNKAVIDKVVSIENKLDRNLEKTKKSSERIIHRLGKKQIN